ncbi:YxeA family protein [Paenibacillus rhizoplanae]|uniref:YxeA family protein n=1 Tax=Paenibacillus rhizoplanae TaxID=1917181 RepID=A0ABW5FJ78_9BACL
MKKTVIFISIALVVCSVLYLTFKRELDQFNPLYKEQYVYAVINKPDGKEGKNEWIRYRYNLTGYTSEGEKKKITFSSSKEQKPESYIRVLAKGAYTKDWIIVEEKVIPEKVLNQLRSH